MKKFGLDEKTGIDLPGEVSGNLSQLTPKSPQIDWDTAAYGQGVAVTPIELVTAIAAIANGGILMRPYVNAALAPQEIGRADQHEHCGAGDADDGGRRGPCPGHEHQRLYACGKDGQRVHPESLQGGGYLNELTDSYIGFGPTSNPRFIAFIRLNTIPRHVACGANRRAGMEGACAVPHQLLQHPSGPDDEQRDPRLP